MTLNDLETALSIHHIGARNGGRAFPELPNFERDIVYTMYDADKDCIEQARSVYQNLPSTLYVLPYCLGAKNGKAPFHIHQTPAASSLKRGNPDVLSNYFMNLEHDYPLSDAFKVMEMRELDVVTLDSIMNTREVEAPPPNVLVLDAEGAEYEILEGAVETIKSNCFAVLTEFCFRPLFQGQKLFGDLCKILSDYGFEFANFENIRHYNVNRVPMGLRSNGFETVGDAVFLRRTEDIKKNIQNPERQALALKKLAYISIVLKHPDYALKALQEIDPAVSIPPTRAYLRFVDEFYEGSKRMPQYLPWTVTEQYPYELLQQIYSPNHQVHSNAVQALDANTKAYLTNLVQQRQADVEALFGEETLIEQFLKRYGLNDQAEAIKNVRLEQMKSIFKRVIKT